MIIGNKMRISPGGVRRPQVKADVFEKVFVMDCVRSGSMFESRSLWLETSRCPQCGAVVPVKSVGILPGRADRFIYRFDIHERHERAAGIRGLYPLLGSRSLLGQNSS
jgi:hypothetical protein